MKESILEKSLRNATNVAGVLAEQKVYGDMKESILEKSLMNTTNGTSVLVKGHI